MTSVNRGLNQECVSLFRIGVERILSNWTALKLAVDHGTGGPQSRELASNLVEYVGDIFCQGGSVEPEDVSDILVEVMDTQFDTWCEDNSPDEIALLLCKLYQLCSQENVSELRTEVDNLPTSAASRSQEIPSIPSSVSQMESLSAAPGVLTEDLEMENETEEDPGWTRVSRRKKQVP